jgi:hypothetical protein
MTSSAASSSLNAYKGRKFAVAVEIDAATVQRLNAALLKLPADLSQKAIRRSFQKWSRGVKAKVAAAAPFGKAKPTERVRGVDRPNPHLKLNVSSKIKTYKKELVQWVAVGIREIPGSYLTPHWYLRWVERGHSTYRRIGRIPRKIRGPMGMVKPSDWEIRVREWEGKNAAEIAAARKDGTISRSGFSRRVSFVPPNPFITRTAATSFRIIEPMVVAEVDKLLREYDLG